uniref:Metalloendopeptidase n=1 Tax=Parastrongyloides trichosuri TaxID=131310 RepID=A0A0N4ZTW3_PARTI
AKWEFPLRYSIESGVYQKIIKEALKKIANETCLKFKKVGENYGTKQELEFVNDSICYTQKGNIYGEGHHYIYLSEKCSKSLAKVQYLVGLALGLVGHHRRHDRDNFITVNESNIDPYKKAEFSKLNESEIATFGVGYDYMSLQNLGEYDYSINGKATNSPKIPYYSPLIKYRTEMTFTDYKLLNLYYCKHKMPPSSKNKCKNGGYSLQKSGKKCKCPKMFIGEQCEKLPHSDKSCEPKVLTANETMQKIFINGKKMCLFKIRPSKPNKKVKVYGYEMKTTEKAPCNENLNLEIKYQNDKGVAGLGACGEAINFGYPLVGNEIFVKYEGRGPKDYINFRYRT